MVPLGGIRPIHRHPINATRMLSANTKEKYKNESTQPGAKETRRGRFPVDERGHRLTERRPPVPRRVLALKPVKDASLRTARESLDSRSNQSARAKSGRPLRRVRDGGGGPREPWIVEISPRSISQPIPCGRNQQHCGTRIVALGDRQLKAHLRVMTAFIGRCHFPPPSVKAATAGC